VLQGGEVLGLAYAVDGAGNLQVDHADGLGSVRAITNGAGAVTQIYQTDAFDVPMRAQGTSAQPFQFAGQQHDTTGLYYLRARMYDPATGRFLSRDPAFGSAADPLSLNRYAYADANPATVRDPSGLCGGANPSDFDEDAVCPGFGPPSGPEADITSSTPQPTATSRVNRDSYSLSQPGRPMIFADTGVLIWAAEGGSANALGIIQAGLTYITPGVYQEFLNVTDLAQRAYRQGFLAAMNIREFSGWPAAVARGSPRFQTIYQTVVGAGHSATDAELAAFAGATGYAAVTTEGRLFRFFQNTYPRLGVPIVRIFP
jgi:RHS repeat-associated protein